MGTRTTVILDEAKLELARRYSGIQEKTALLHAGLDALIAREAGKRLAAMGGFAPGFRAGRRRRSRPAA